MNKKLSKLTPVLFVIFIIAILAIILSLGNRKQTLSSRAASGVPTMIVMPSISPTFSPNNPSVPPMVTMPPQTILSGTWGFGGYNWCYPGTHCETEWLDAPDKPIYCPAGMGIANSGTYIKRADGKKKFIGRSSICFFGPTEPTPTSFPLPTRTPTVLPPTRVPTPIVEPTTEPPTRVPTPIIQ